MKQQTLRIITLIGAVLVTTLGTALIWTESFAQEEDPVLPELPPNIHTYCELDKCRLGEGDPAPGDPRIQCYGDDDCVYGFIGHYGCDGPKCVYIKGYDENKCSIETEDTDCGGAPPPPPPPYPPPPPPPPSGYHSECSNAGQCITVQGDGLNECSNSSDCTHSECNDQLQCVQRIGIGRNTCNSNLDCGYNKCNEQLQCERVAQVYPPQQDQCPRPGYDNYCYGSVSVDKTARGGDDTFPFISNILNNNTFKITTKDGQGNHKIEKVKPGKYSITEDPPEGWEIETENCSSITVNAGGVTGCRVYNVKKKAKLVIEKKTIGGDGTFRYYIFPTPGVRIVTTENGKGKTEELEVDPDIKYTIEEHITGGTAWDLIDVKCDQNFDQFIQNEGRPNENLIGATNVTIKPGKTTTCIFTNSTNSLVIQKKVSGEDTTFEYLIYPGNKRATVTTENNFGKSEKISLPSGTYAIQEILPQGKDWRLIDVFCADEKGARINFRRHEREGVLLGVELVDILPGRTTTCNFENTQGGGGTGGSVRGRSPIPAKPESP